MKSIRFPDVPRGPERRYDDSDLDAKDPLATAAIAVGVWLTIAISVACTVRVPPRGGPYLAGLHETSRWLVAPITPAEGFDRVGLPFRGMFFVRSGDVTTDPRLVHVGLVLATRSNTKVLQYPWQRGPGWPARTAVLVLPLGIRPLPFAANVAFWAACIVALKAAARRMRRRWTTRPGVCAQCRYPLLTASGCCPECGWTADDRSV